MNIINHLLRVYKFLSPLIKIHRRLSRNAHCGVIFHSNETDLHANFSWTFLSSGISFYSWLILLLNVRQKKNERKFLAHLRLRRRRKRLKSEETKLFSVERARCLALSDHGSYFNQKEWLEELARNGPRKKAESKQL